MKYTLDYLRNNKVAIHCPTKELAIKVSDILYPISKNYDEWYYWGDKSAIDLYSGKYGFATMHAYVFAGFDMVNAEDFLKEPETMTEVEMWDNMQYYMEYCQYNDYVTPEDWIKNHKTF